MLKDKCLITFVKFASGIVNETSTPQLSPHPNKHHRSQAIARPSSCYRRPFLSKTLPRNRSLAARKRRSEGKAREERGECVSVGRSLLLVMSTPARRRLMRDFRRLQNDPPSGVTGAPMDNNILAWQVKLMYFWRYCASGVSVLFILSGLWTQYFIFSENQTLSFFGSRILVFPKMLTTTTLRVRT